MNERVTELIWKADQYSLSNVSRGRDSEFFHTIAMNKLTELIVRECIDISEAHAKSPEAQPCDPILEQYEDGIVNGIYEATAAIKEHFGVEE